GLPRCSGCSRGRAAPGWTSAQLRRGPRRFRTFLLPSDLPDARSQVSVSLLVVPCLQRDGLEEQRLCVADEGSILAWLPCGDKAPVLIVTCCVAVLGEVVVAEVCTTGLIAVEGVDAHELTEVDVVGNACCVFEDLVHLLRGTGDLNVGPEILAEGT